PIAFRCLRRQKLTRARGPAVEFAGPGRLLHEAQSMNHGQERTGTDTNRRAFLTRSACTVAALAAGAAARGSFAADQPAAARDTRGTAATAPAARANRIATSTYSFWRFMDGLKLPVERCIEEAAAMGF